MERQILREQRERELEVKFELHGAIVILNEYSKLHLLVRGHAADYTHADFDRVKSLQRIKRACNNYLQALEDYQRIIF